MADVDDDEKAEILVTVGLYVVCLSTEYGVLYLRVYRIVPQWGRLWVCVCL